RPPELPGVERMVGLFINTVPVRVRPRPGEPVTALLARLRREQAPLAGAHHVSLADIRPPGVGRGELFDTLLLFENHPTGGLVGPVGTGELVAGVEERDATHYPLTVCLRPGRRLAIEVSCRTGAASR